MSEENAPTPEQEPVPQATETPRVRRISNPRPKKQAKAKVAETAAEAPVSEPVEAKSEPAAEVSESFEEAPESNDWPETEPATVGGQTPSEGGSKRKRRRKKGKGGQNPQNNPQQAPVSADGEPTIETVVENAPAQPQRHQHPQQQQQRPKVDPELLAKFAWKIYLSEVSEEGIALINDNDAREISRRCFRLAEIFLEEQGRRR